MKGDYKLEIMSERFEPIDTVIDTQPTRLVKYYYQILNIMDSMDEALRRASDYPEDLTKEDEIEVQAALEEIGMALQKHEAIFNGFDE